MGDKHAFVVYGVVQDDLPDCPHEDGWYQWADDIGWFNAARDYALHCSYEAEPAVLGLAVAVMAYRDTEVLSTLSTPHQGWDQFRALAKAHGVKVPEGTWIVTVDE